MKETFVHTQYNSEPTPGVKLSDEIITEQTGYRSTKEIVEGMILAGQRLEDYRHGRLDEFLEESYQEPIERYQRDPVDEEADIVRKLRYRSENKWQKDSEEEAGEKSVEDSVGNTTVPPAGKELEGQEGSSKS